MNFRIKLQRDRYSEIRGYEAEQHFLLMLQGLGTKPNFSDVSNKC